MSARAAVFALALMLPLPLAAQEIDCYTTSVQIEMTFCAEQDWIAADEDLNQAYVSAREILRMIDDGLPEAQQGAAMQLRDAQRAWITFRDAACAAEGYMMHGGSAEPMVIYGCRARLTQVRAQELWALGEMP